MAFKDIGDLLGDPSWRPLADIYRHSKGWLIKLELAGVRREDIGVQIAGSQVRIIGHRRDFLVREGCTQYSMELSYNRLERLIQLPCDLDRARLELELRDGILLVRVFAEEDCHE